MGIKKIFDLTCLVCRDLLWDSHAIQSMTHFGVENMSTSQDILYRVVHVTMICQCVHHEKLSVLSCFVANIVRPNPPILRLVQFARVNQKSDFASRRIITLHASISWKRHIFAWISASSFSWTKYILLMNIFSRSCFHESDLLEPKRISSVGEGLHAQLVSPRRVSVDLSYQ